MIIPDDVFVGVSVTLNQEVAEKVFEKNISDIELGAKCNIIVTAEIESILLPTPKPEFSEARVTFLLTGATINGHAVAPKEGQ